MTIELTYDEAVSLLERAVAERGESYIYEQQPTPHRDTSTSCLYTHADGTPGCLIGLVLSYKGWTVDYRARNNSVGIQGLIHSGVIRADDNTGYLLEMAQESQDGGLTWGEAVRRAKERVEEPDEYEGD